MSAQRNPFPSHDQILPIDLVTELVRLSHSLGDVTDEYAEAAYDFGEADSNYRKQKAVSYTTITTDERQRPKKEQRTVAAISALVDIECETERLAQRLTKARKEALKEKIESTRVQINALQSVSNALREEMKLAGRDGR
jgi:hypothetical protein